MAPDLTHVFQLVLATSWQSSLVILLILFIRPWMGRAIPARWRYGLWALVLLRLLVPVSVFPPSPVSLQNIAVMDRPLGQISAVAPPPWAHEPRLEFVRQGPVDAPVFSTLPTARATPFSIPWWTIAAAVWLVGAAISLAITLLAQAALWRRLEKNRLPVDPAVAATWRTCCARLHIARPPLLCVSSDVASPALVGLFRPVLLLPDTRQSAFSPGDWENILVHELAHYRCGDHWIHALELAALAVHWFNPLVWLGFRQLRADRELAADEWALRHMAGDRSCAYGETLLKVLKESPHHAVLPTAVGILEDRTQLKQRLRRIVGFGPRTVVGSLLGLAIVIAAAVLVLSRSEEKADLSDYAGLKPNEILCEAAHDGNLPAIRQMLRDGVDVNTLNAESTRSALDAAVAAGRLDVVRFLIAHGADVNRPDGKHETPLAVALENGKHDCADYLTAHGATTDPALLAAEHGDQATLAAHLPTDVEHLEILSRVAALSNQADTFRYLVRKIRVMPGESYRTPGDGVVVLAIALGYRDVVQVALDETPFRDKLNKGGVMRIGWAAAQSPGMRDWLISKGFTVPEYTDGERLIDATEHEDLAEMERLLKKGVDVNYRGESSWTPITKAAAWNKPRAVKLLLAHGADPNSVHLPGWDYTPICLTDKPAIADMVLAAGGNLNATLYQRNVHIMDYSVTFGATDMVKWYLAHGVDPTKVQADGPDKTFLFDAGNPEIAALLIAHGVNVNTRDKEGSTALMQICMFGKKPAPTVLVLLQHGADPNVRDKFGRTPLMQAKDGATVDVLVQYGADVHAKTKDGQSILAGGGGNADPTWMQALIRHGAAFDTKTDGPTKLMSAAWRNQVDVMTALLNSGVDPNLKGVWNKQANDYMTPLTAAVVDGQYDAAQLLVEHGARIDDQVMNDALFNRRTTIVKLFWDHGNRSISELTYDISQGRPVAEIQKLIDAGAPVNPAQGNSIQPIALAAELGQLDVVKLLVQHGAQIKGATASVLDDAAQEGQDEVIAYLVQQGAKPDYQTLWNAAWNCNPYPEQRSKDHFEKTMRLLLDAGAARGLSQQQNTDILCAAVFSRYPGGNTKVIQMLIDSGMSLHARNKQGQSVLDLAHQACKQETCSTPTKDMMAFLDQADKAEVTH